MNPGRTASSHERRARWLLLALAVGMTGLNALEPLHIDGPFTAWIAEQIARAPLDPYGFELFWGQWPQPASEELTPPVLPYWTAIAVRLFGDSPVLWKLWLLPFCALFVVSLYRLLRRFAEPMALPFVILVALSPSQLPALNLMQDVPAQALGLGALGAYLASHDRRSWLGALAAGVLAALAAQTKYTQVGVVGVMLVHGLLFRRLGLAALAAGVSGGLFLLWEWLMALRYGQGMLAGQLGTSLYWAHRLDMILPLLRLLGATAPFLGVLSLHALGLPRTATLSLGLLTLAGFAALCAWPIETPLFLALGIGVVAALAGVAARATLRGVNGGGRRTARLLVAWILIEGVLYFAAAPFAAVRRVMGLGLVGSILVARCVPTSPHGRRTTWALVAASSLLGCLYALVDLQEARTQREGVLRAEALIRERDPQPTIWFVGHWGFQHHAERRGMQPLVPDASRLARGDWLLVSHRVHQQEIALEPSELRLIRTLTLPAWLPLQTGTGYYGSATPLAHLGARADVSILRARRDFVARSAWTARKLWEWTQLTSGRTAAAALPALIQHLADPDADERLYAVRGLARLGSRARPALPALRARRADDDGAVRRAAERAIEAIESG